MSKSINHYLQLLNEYDPLTAEQHARMDARVRREVIARHGSFALPKRSGAQLSSFSDLNLSSSPAFWLSSFKGLFLQPAMAFASIAAIAIGIGVFQLATSERGGQTPKISMSEPVARPAVVADVLPGSGIALSVFALSQNTTPTVAPATTITTKKTWRKPKALNPAAGVFTNWGTSVFSKEEIMRQQAKELAVFSG